MTDRRTPDEPGAGAAETSTRHGALVTVTGGTGVALGVSVILGWHLGIAPLVRPTPGSPVTQYVSGLVLVLLGGALLARRAHRDRLCLAAAGLAVGLAILTLGEYALGVDFVVHRLGVTDTIAHEVEYPGRMAPNTAVAVIAVGVALSLLGPGRAGRYRPPSPGTRPNCARSSRT